ncbi:hypothetical protein D3C72_2255650 [compost metagenome]
MPAAAASSAGPWGAAAGAGRLLVSARAIQAISDERMASSTDIWMGWTQSCGTKTV